MEFSHWLNRKEPKILGHKTRERQYRLALVVYHLARAQYHMFFFLFFFYKSEYSCFWQMFRMSENEIYCSPQLMRDISMEIKIKKKKLIRWKNVQVSPCEKSETFWIALLQSREPNIFTPKIFASIYWKSIFSYLDF